MGYKFDKRLIFFLNVVCLQLPYVKCEWHQIASPNTPLFNSQFICKVGGIFSAKLKLSQIHASSDFFLFILFFNLSIGEQKVFKDISVLART